MKTIIFVGIAWLFLIGWFVQMKLDGYVDWSWGWVLCPAWFPVVAGFVIWCIICWSVGKSASEEMDGPDEWEDEVL